MRAIEIQNKMNKRLVSAIRTQSKKQYEHAYKLYVAMNKLREIEGLPFLSMPSLEKRIRANYL